MARSKKAKEENVEVAPVVKRGRGRPRKNVDPSKKAPVKKLTLEEKQEIKLKRQQLRNASKAALAANTNANLNFYCTNKELTAELIKWRDSSPDPEKRVLSNELGEMLIKIANKILNHSNFRHYDKELKEDMRSFFFYKAIRGLKTFNFNFNNPFAFFSMIAFNSYLTIVFKHYKHINIKKSLMQKLLTELETYSGLLHNSALAKSMKQYIDFTDDDSSN